MIFTFLLACTTAEKKPSSIPIETSTITEEGATEGSLLFLTYNVHGLPSLITGDDTEERMTQIAPLLQDFDIIGLQEDFDSSNHETLCASDHETKTWFDDVLDSSRAYGSGLSIFARLPLQDFHHEHYDECNGVVDSASDCLASKGFQIARLQLSTDIEIDVYNTHLEAGGSEADNQARASHVQQLLDALNGWSANRPVIFLGDTNLHPGDPTDQPLLEQLQNEGGLLDSCAAVSCAETNHIDRIFYRNNAEVEFTITQWTNEPAFFDEQGVPLSDHPAISSEIIWELQ